MTAAVHFAVALALLMLLPAPAFAVNVAFTNPADGATVSGSTTIEVLASNGPASRSGWSRRSSGSITRA